MSSDTRERPVSGSVEANPLDVDIHDPGNVLDAVGQVVTYRSDIDGAVVVEIETGAGIGRLRVYVNDGPIFDQKSEEPGPHGTCGFVWRENDISPATEGHHRCTLRSGHRSVQHYCSTCGAEYRS